MKKIVHTFKAKGSFSASLAMLLQNKHPRLGINEIVPIIGMTATGSVLN